MEVNDSYKHPEVLHSYLFGELEVGPAVVPGNVRHDARLLVLQLMLFNFLSSLLKLWGQHSHHFVAYEWAQYARVFVTGKPLRPSVMKHSSSLGPFNKLR
jgi:hypothetical protein